MNRTVKLDEQLQGVFAVPPLARKSDAKRTIDFDRNSDIVADFGNRLDGFSSLVLRVGNDTSDIAACRHG